VASYLTICATESNFHRTSLRRGPGKELRSQFFRPVNAEEISRFMWTETIGETLTVCRSFADEFKRYGDDGGLSSTDETPEVPHAAPSASLSSSQE